MPPRLAFNLLLIWERPFKLCFGIHEASWQYLQHQEELWSFCVIRKWSPGSHPRWHREEVTVPGFPGLLSSLRASFKSSGLYSLTYTQISGEWETQTEKSIFSKAKLGGWGSGFLPDFSTILCSWGFWWPCLSAQLIHPEPKQCTCWHIVGAQ